MTVRSKSSGQYLTIHGTFRPHVTAKERVESNFQGPCLASTTESLIPRIADRFKLDPSDLEIGDPHAF
jgi:hypothetical protein